jgi:mono/diheme cytochrome c family protein
MNSAILRTFARVVAAALMAWSAALVAAGGQAPAAAASVFTVKQAGAGKVAYAKSCASCHLPDLSGDSEIPALAGTAFKEIWGSRSTKDLFDYIAAAMPYGAASLTVEEYRAVTAYILQVNGALGGEQELTASTSVTISSLTPAPTAK